MKTFQEIIVEPGHTVNHMGHSGEHLRFRLKAGAVLNYFLAVLDVSKTHVIVDLEGEASRVDSQVIFFGDQEQEQDIRVEHVHRGRETHSIMHSRGAVKDKAWGRFYGLVRMEKGATGADGHLNEHNLLLSPNARIEAVPALEIEHDDVKASHSATLEKVDAERLFYLCSRGLDESAAVQVLVEGFFTSALESLPLEQREDLYSAILKKL